MVYVKEASSIVALQDAVGAAPQQHTTTTTVRMEHRDGKSGRTLTPRHSSHSPASSLCRWRRPRTTSSNANGTPPFDVGSISNSALRAGSSPSLPPAHLYREVAGRETVDIDPEIGSAPRRRRFVGGGEWSAGGCCGVEGHEERESLLVRSRWEGVEGCQKVRARGKRTCYGGYCQCVHSDEIRRTNLVNLPAFATFLPQWYLHSRHVYA